MSTNEINKDLKQDGVHQGIANFMAEKPERRSSLASSDLSYAKKSTNVGFKGYDRKETATRPPKENVGSLLNKGADSKFDYGAKRTRMTSADKTDKVMEYEKENNVLKTKGTLLENEITKMKTKLHRIEGLMRSRSKFGDAEDFNISDMQQDLQNECDEIRTQNDEMKEKVRKLNVIQRGLAAPSTAQAKPNKYAHVPGKLAFSASGKMSKKYA